MFSKIYDDSIEVYSGREVNNKDFIQGKSYYFLEFNDIFDDNSLLINEDNIVFNATFSISLVNYNASVSVKLYKELLLNCIKNQFVTEIHNKDAVIHLMVQKEEDLLKQDEDISFYFITLKGHNVEELIGKMRAAASNFTSLIYNYNDTIKEALSSCKFLKVSDDI